jgi:hypothetical protein
MRALNGIFSNRYPGVERMSRTGFTYPFRRSCDVSVSKIFEMISFHSNPYPTTSTQSQHLLRSCSRFALPGMGPLSPSLAARLSARSAIRSSHFISLQAGFAPSTPILVSSPCNGCRHIHSNTGSNRRKFFLKSPYDFSEKVDSPLSRSTDIM